MAFTDQEILTGLAEIINAETGVDTDAVEPGKSFQEDLDVDSLSMMQILVEAEDKFGVKIPDDATKDMRTVQDAIDFIKKSA